MLQETLLAAWRGLGRFEERASLRTWLYQIATNRCLNALRASGRQAAARDRARARFPPPEPTRRSASRCGSSRTPTPCSTACPTPRRARRRATRPGKRSRSRSSPPLQHLPPRQRAVLVLRDVLGFPRRRGRRHARLQRGVGEQRPAAGPGHARRAVPAPSPRPGAAATVRPRARGHRRGSPTRSRPPMTARLVALLTDDAWLSMPPAAARVPGSRRDRRVLLSRTASRHAAHPADPDPGQRPARVRPLPSATRTRRVDHANGMIVLTLAGDQICAITRFIDNSLFPHFGLPRTLRD